MSKNNVYNLNKWQSGFTLVEIMVAVSIFTIVVTVGMGALLTVNNAHKKTKDMRQAVVSVTSAIEYMMREMRTGYSFVCDGNVTSDLSLLVPGAAGDCTTTPSSEIAFLDQDGVQQHIYWDSGYNSIGQIYRQTGYNSATNPQQITDSSIVDIDDVNFYLSGVQDTSPSHIQPFVVVQVKGKVIGQPNSNFTFQSSISQRLLDVTQP